jgi:hypothetical protein
MVLQVPPEVLDELDDEELELLLEELELLELDELELDELLLDELEDEELDEPGHGDTVGVFQPQPVPVLHPVILMTVVTLFILGPPSGDTETRFSCPLMGPTVTVPSVCQSPVGGKLIVDRTTVGSSRRWKRICRVKSEPFA